MPKSRDIGAALKKRVEESAVEAAQNEQFVDDVYRVIIGGRQDTGPAKVYREYRGIPATKLRNFYTTQIGFRPYSQSDLEALADDIAENGLLEYGIVRPIPGTDEYEILSGRNRKDACVLLGWDIIPFNVEVCDDARAIVIATVTNLKRRQNLLHSERGWAYRALLEAQRRQGNRLDLATATSVEFQQKLTTRDKVAQIFGVKAHEVQRDIRLTYLIQPLLDAIDSKRLKIGCGTVLAGYDKDSQQAFLSLWKEMGSIPPKLMNRLKKECPAPTLSITELRQAWENAAGAAAAPPAPQIFLALDRQRFEAVISEFGGEEALEKLFFEFLESRA